MIYFNNFDLLKEKKQLHNTAILMQTLQNKVKLEKELFEIRQINIILIEKTLEKDEYNDIQ